MDKKVTIVIPTFNRAQYVSKTIDSALAQTVQCNIIVCDHGSTDNTPDIIKQYGDKILYIRREKDFGPHFCWLEGILNANTEFVHLHFDDDLMQPTFIEETLNLMTDDVGMVFTEATLYDVIEEKIIRKELFNFKNKFKKNLVDSSIVESKLLKGLMLSPAACLYRKKDMIDAIYQGNLPIDFGGNYHGVGPDLLMNLLAVIRYPKIGVILEPLVYFGYHPGSITIDASEDKIKQQKLTDGYNAYRRYYYLMKLYKENKTVYNLVNKAICINKKLKWNKKIEKQLKIFFKAIGIRKKEIK